MRTVLRQTRRTLLAQPALVLLLAVLVALTSGGLALADAFARQDAFDYQRRLVAAGRYVYKAQARTETGEGLIPAGACAALNRTPGVRAAVGFMGGARGSVPVTLAKAPGEHLTLRTVSGNPAPVLDPTSEPRFDDGFYMDAGLAARLGMGEGMRVELTENTDVVVAAADGSVAGGGAGDGTRERPETITATVHVLDMSARGFNESQTIVAIGPATGTVAECLVEFEPGAWGDAARQTVAAALGDGRTVVSIAPMLADDAMAASPLTQYRQRISRLFWLVSGLACFAIAFTPVAFRRHEFALYRSVGAGRNPTALVYALVSAAPLAVGHAGGLAWAVLAFQWTRRMTPQPGAIAAAACASLFVAVAATAAGCIVLSRGSMARFIQHRL